MTNDNTNNGILWLPVLFGIGIGGYFCLPFEPSQWLTLALMEILLLTAFVARFHPQVLKIIACVGVVLAGFADIELKTLYLDKNLPEALNGRFYLQGTIINIDTNYNSRKRILLDNIKNFSGDSLKGRYRLTVMRKNQKLKVGECVELTAEISPPMKADMVGGYQPDRKLFFEGINAQGYVLSEIYPIKCEKSINPFILKLHGLRENIKNKIAAVLPEDEAAIATAIITGNRELMKREQTSSYQDAGLSHFLSISGLHMSMIAGLTFFLIRLLMAFFPCLSLKYNSKKAAAVAGIIVSTLYLMISGFAVPAQRAYIMTFIVMWAVILERHAISMRSLMIAAMIILIFSPQMLINISFQLSFAAVVALVAFYEKCGGKIEQFIFNPEAGFIRRTFNTMIAYLLGIIVADLVASLATLPFTIYHFNRFSLYTSLTNLLAGPLIGFMIMPAILITLLSMPFGFYVWPLKVAGLGIKFLNEITSYVAGLPSSVIEVYSPPLIAMIAVTFGLLWLCLNNSKIRYWGLVLILGSALSLFMVEVPDMVVGDKGNTIALKNKYGCLQTLSGGNRWMKENWRQKFVCKNGKEDKSLERPKLADIDWEEAIGYSVYGNNIKTIRDYIGFRPWNKGR
ncbi:MAG: ComEC/Rec2 family competence protein [Alphaproteobacteria bacterium]|nr:ComEC/Rec2 family competence protein [Alphaproteobacteria bacterium]MBR1649498.1 ComEC/Rec2 family competence protein [Alphaproteobacteria bacterium]